MSWQLRYLIFGMLLVLLNIGSLHNIIYTLHIRFAFSRGYKIELVLLRTQNPCTVGTVNIMLWFTTMLRPSSSNIKSAVQTKVCHVL